MEELIATHTPELQIRSNVHTHKKQQTGLTAVNHQNI